MLIISSKMSLPASAKTSAPMQCRSASSSWKRRAARQ